MEVSLPKSRDEAAATEEEGKVEKEELKEEEREEENALIFLDSLDSYITLFDSLSSTLRQGWLELASARHSMGSSRISSALFDLKEHTAATKLQVTESIDASPSVSQPHYTLSKWASFEEDKCSFKEADASGLQKESNRSHLRHRGSSHLSESAQETNSATSVSSLAIDNKVQQERSKSLSVFGALVSPKLRSAQVSFETALETIIEIANMRSLMLSAFSQLQQEKESSN